LLNGLCACFINVASASVEIFRGGRRLRERRGGAPAIARVESDADRPHVVDAATNKSRGRGDGIKPKRRYVPRAKARSICRPRIRGGRPDGPRELLGPPGLAHRRAGNTDRRAAEKKVSDRISSETPRLSTRRSAANTPGDRKRNGITYGERSRLVRRSRNGRVEQRRQPPFG